MLAVREISYLCGNHFVSKDQARTQMTFQVSSASLLKSNFMYKGEIGMRSDWRKAAVLDEAIKEVVEACIHQQLLIIDFLNTQLDQYVSYK